MTIFTYHIQTRSSQVWKKGQQVQSEADAEHLPHWARSRSQSPGSVRALELQTAAVTCLYLTPDIHYKYIYQKKFSRAIYHFCKGKRYTL